MKNSLILVVIISLLSCNNNNGAKETFMADTSKERVTSTVGIKDTVKTEVAPEANTDAAALIIPGKSIGQTSINETSIAVADRFGPATSGDAAMGKSISTWKSKDGKHSTTIYFTTMMGMDSAGPRASQIRITSPYFKTANNIKVGDMRSVVLQAFPSAIKTYKHPVSIKGHEAIVYDDVKMGIAFEFDDDICIGITIHKPGEKAFETYLGFFDNLKEA